MNQISKKHCKLRYHLIINFPERKLKEYRICPYYLHKRILLDICLMWFWIITNQQKKQNGRKTFLFIWEGFVQYSTTFNVSFKFMIMFIYKTKFKE